MMQNPLADSSSALPTLKELDVINNWRIVTKLGEGSFGAVFKVKHTKSGQDYALKTEHTQSLTRVLKMEVVVLRALKYSNAVHCCAIHDAGRAEGHHFIVMTLVGQSLQDLRKLNSTPSGISKLSMGCAISVGLQCLEAIQEVHNIGYLHRDVKPANFAISLEDPRRLLILDFGMCRKFLQGPDAVRKPRWTAGFRGTVRYASINSHLSRDQSRKDDLESWLYQQIELTSGQLPWKHLEDHILVCHAKEKGRSADVHTLFGGCPKEYVHVMVYIDNIKYYDNPKYSIIRGLLREALKTNNLSEFPYDWEKKVPKSS